MLKPSSVVRKGLLGSLLLLPVSRKMKPTSPASEAELLAIAASSKNLTLVSGLAQPNLPMSSSAQSSTTPEDKAIYQQIADNYHKHEAGISWNGFNVFGDTKSIAEINRLIHYYASRDGVK